MNAPLGLRDVADQWRPWYRRNAPIGWNLRGANDAGNVMTKRTLEKREGKAGDVDVAIQRKQDSDKQIGRDAFALQTRLMKVFDSILTLAIGARASNQDLKKKFPGEIVKWGAFEPGIEAIERIAVDLRGLLPPFARREDESTRERRRDARKRHSAANKALFNSDPILAADELLRDVSVNRAPDEMTDKEAHAQWKDDVVLTAIRRHLGRLLNPSVTDAQILAAVAEYRKPQATVKPRKGAKGYSTVESRARVALELVDATADAEKDAGRRLRHAQDAWKDHLEELKLREPRDKSQPRKSR